MRAPEVKALVDTLTERVNNLVRSLEDVNGELKRVAQAHNDLHREQDREVALLKREIEELKKGKDVVGQRAFTAALALASAVVGAILINLLKKP